MEAKRLEERLGPNRIEDPSTAAVQAIFRDRSQVARTLEPLLEQFGAHRALAMALLGAAAALLFLLGFAFGGGFSDDAPGAPSQGVFVDEQTALLEQQSIDLQETRSSLAVALGESAFLRSQVDALTNDAERLQGALNQAQLEMRILIGVYEECLDRLYPA